MFNIQYRSGLALTILFAACFFAQPSFSQSLYLTDLQIYNRCYLRLVHSVVPRTASLGLTLQTAVLQGKKTGQTACRELLESSLFGNDGKLANISSDESRAILRNLHNFHSSWFQNKMVNVNGSYRNATLILRDSDESALYFTKALFSPNGKVSEALTSNQTLRSIRVTPDALNLTRWKSKTFSMLNETGHKESMILAEWTTAAPNIQPRMIDDHRLIGFGDLVGVEAQLPFYLDIDPGALPTTDARNVEFNPISKAASVGYDFFKHFGGGVLGTQMYILKNSNLGINEVHGGKDNDKDSLIPRRLTSKVFEDLLCHELPTLLEEDIRADVDESSNHGFRQEASCMRCHSSLDPLAYTYRNLMTQVTSMANTGMPTLGSPALVVKQLPKSSSATTIFALQDPVGKLRFRDHKGKLTSVDVKSLSEVGLEMSKSDDFYRCVAKRYYQYFTGINIRLTPVITTEGTNKTHQNFVYALGDQLKKDQSIKEMIVRIMNSETFRRRDLGVLGATNE